MALVSTFSSAPEVLVQDVIARLKELGANSVREMDGIVENVALFLPNHLN